MTREVDIINKIINDKKIKRYKELESVINSNETVKRKLDELKNLQKEIVHAESLQKSNSLEILKNKYDQLYNAFIEQPLIGEYIELQTMINDFLQAFTSIIEDGIKADLNNK